jgi:hypothetical protein
MDVLPARAGRALITSVRRDFCSPMKSGWEKPFRPASCSPSCSSGDGASARDPDAGRSAPPVGGRAHAPVRYSRRRHRRPAVGAREHCWTSIPGLSNPSRSHRSTFIKQPEVLAALRALLWDMLIVDEAHQASAASLRYDAVRHLALRARHVVLVTATPHTGDPAAFAALCRLGQLGADDPLMLFRRTRHQAGLDRRRRVHLLRVSLSPRALEMHERLEAYVNRLWAIGESGGRRDVSSPPGEQARILECWRAGCIDKTAAHNAIGGDIGFSAPLPFDTDADASDDTRSPGAAFADTSEEHRMRCTFSTRRPVPPRTSRR